MRQKLSTIITWIIIVCVIILGVSWFAWFKYYPWNLWFKGYRPKPVIPINLANSIVGNYSKQFTVSISKSALLNDYAGSKKFAGNIGDPLVEPKDNFFEYIKYKKDRSLYYSGNGRSFYYVFYPIIGYLNTKVTKCNGNYLKQQCDYTCSIKYNKNYIKFKQKFTKNEWSLLLSNPKNYLILIKKRAIESNRIYSPFDPATLTVSSYNNGTSIIIFYRNDKDKWKLNYPGDLCSETDGPFKIIYEQ